MTALTALRRNGALVRFAYSLTKSDPPSQVNLCPFFWRCVFTLVGWVLYLTFIAVDYVVMRGLGALPVLVLFGYWPRKQLKWRPSKTSGSGDYWFLPYTPFDPITWWPKFHRAHIMPLAVAVIIAGIVVVAAIVFVVMKWIVLTLIWSWIIKIFFGSLVFGTMIGNLILWSLAALLVWAIIGGRVEKTETWRAATTYAKAWREGWCPVIPIVDDEQKEDES